MNSKVYIVQRPAYYDRIKRGWVNKYDLSAARDHGEFVFLLRPGNIFRDKLADSIRRLEEGLRDFTENDHLLAIGDPIAIAAAAFIAARNANGRLSVLKFDRQNNKYEPYMIQTANNKGST